jgi:hypothetical protein
MIWLVLLLLAVCGVAVISVKRQQPPPEIDPEEASRAAVDLYAIRSRLDVAWMRTELRREGTRLRRMMAEELDEGEPGEAP